MTLFMETQVHVCYLFNTGVSVQCTLRYALTMHEVDHMTDIIIAKQQSYFISSPI